MKFYGQEDEDDATAAVQVADDQIAAGKNIFRFDHVWPGSTSQEEIYRTLIQPLVSKVLYWYILNAIKVYYTVLEGL
jgi:hypothetical protein